LALNSISNLNIEPAANIGCGKKRAPQFSFFHNCSKKFFTFIFLPTDIKLALSSPSQKPLGVIASYTN